MKIQVARKFLFVAMLSLAVGACSASETDSQHKLELGLKVTDTATAADVGLPRYPGSKPYKESSDDSSSAANIGLATPLFGFKLAALNLETPDKPARVGAFYRQALAKYGNVLECSDGVETSPVRSDDLKCDSDEHATHSVVYKVGTEENQRIVAIKPHGNGTRFSLVHFDIRDESKE